MTLYVPDRRTPSAGAQRGRGQPAAGPGPAGPAVDHPDRPCGRMTDAEVNPRAGPQTGQLSYVEAQAEIDGGSPRETRPAVAARAWRERREVERGGVSLQTPEQEVVADESGWRLAARRRLPVEVGTR